MDTIDTSPLFSSMRKRAGACFATLAGAKQMLEATPSVKTSVSNILKDSPARRLGHQAPSDRLLQKILQVKREFIFIVILIDENTLKFDDPANNFKPQSEEELEIYKQVLDSIYARFGEYLPIYKISRSTLRLEPIYEGLQRITKASK